MSADMSMSLELAAFVIWAVLYTMLLLMDSG